MNEPRLKYNKYKIYIERPILKTMTKKKPTKKNITKQKLEESLFVASSETTSNKSKPHGHFEGINWVWPNGKKTHVRFIDLAIRQKRPLPRGFYIEAEKNNYLTNIGAMLRKAMQLKLPDSVDIRNEE